MQINLSNQDMDYLSNRSGLSKSRIHQIVRKANSNIFSMVAEKIFDVVD